MYSKVIAGVI